MSGIPPDVQVHVNYKLFLLLILCALALWRQRAEGCLAGAN